MDFKFSKGSGDAPQQESHGEKKNQNALLVLLLLLVGGFSYVYFFTGLIKPSEAPKPAEAPAPPVVKMSLPSRDGNTSAVDAKAKDQGNEASQAKTQAPKPVQSPPAATVAPAPAATAAKAPTPQPVKPREQPQKSEPSKAAEKKSPPAPVVEKKAQKAAVAKVEEKKPAAERKQIPAVKRVETTKPADKKVAAEKSAKPKKPVTATTAVAKEGAGKAWSLLVGQYLLEEALSTDMGRVRKAGLEPVVKAGARKKAAMNRLMFAEFADRAGAQAAIAKLKRHTSDAFIIDQAGKHVVYAGSYLLDARAASEKERLEAAGFPVSLKRAEIAIPTQSLTIGPFSEKKAADAALDKLKVAGIKATLIHQ